MRKTINSFIKTNGKYLDCDKKTVEDILIGDKLYSFVNQPGFDEVTYMQENIRNSVSSYTFNKGTAISIYKALVVFYESKSSTKLNINFPDIDVSNSFERQMYISKYLQDPEHKVIDLKDKLWVSERTIKEDLAKLRGMTNDPIQICGKKFIISDTTASRGSLHFASTAHPLFLTPNLTQVLVMLKGLKVMSEDAIYEEYAIRAAQSIWSQLSNYAKNRIHYVLSELLPDDLEWYKELQLNEEELFYTEFMCSERNVFLDCLKNDLEFFAEYDENGTVMLLSNCKVIPGTYDGKSFEVNCNKGKKRLIFDNILRSSYSEEGLL